LTIKPRSCLHNIHYVNVQTPLKIYIILKVTQNFDFSVSDHTPWDSPNLYNLRTGLHISQLFFLNEENVINAWKNQSSACILLKIEWKRTHLEGKNWANFSRCQWLCNNIICYVVLTSFYLSGKGSILRKQLVLDVKFILKLSVTQTTDIWKYWTDWSFQMGPLPFTVQIHSNTGMSKWHNKVYHHVMTRKISLNFHSKWVISHSIWIKFEQDTSRTLIFPCICCIFLIEKKSMRNIKTKFEIRQIGAISESL
jgi:hypothetical protein